MLGELGTINIRRAYGNWAKASLKGWGELTGLHSIVPMQQFDVVKGKSATDMRMTIDAMDLLYRGNVDGFGIMSSDSDFLPLAQRIREDGLPGLRLRHRQDPAVLPAGLHALFRRRRACARRRGAARAADAGKGQRPVDTELLQVLGSAYKASKRDEEGYTPLSELGQRAKAVSSFAARNYGYTRLSELIKAVPNFEVKSGDDGRLVGQAPALSSVVDAFIHRYFGGEFGPDCCPRDTAVSFSTGNGSESTRGPSTGLGANS